MKKINMQSQGNTVTIEINGQPVEIILRDTDPALYERESVFRSRKNGRLYLLVLDREKTDFISMPNGIPVEQNICYYNLCSLQNNCKMRASKGTPEQNCVLTTGRGVSIPALNSRYRLDLEYVSSFNDYFTMKSNVSAGKQAPTNTFGATLVQILNG